MTVDHSEFDFLKSSAYCERVDKENLLNRKYVSEQTAIDDGSELISLKGKGFNLIYEPSFIEDYNYLVRAAIVEKIGRISEKLEAQGKVLIIRSAWRSFKHQRAIWDNRVKLLRDEFPKDSIEAIKEKVSCFIAPEAKSMHATGGAVDALILDSKSNTVLDFGTNEGLIITLNKYCYPYHPQISAEAKKNRELLIGLFEEEDFVVDVKEYWHFDYGNAIWGIKKGKKPFYGIIKEI